MSLPGNHYLNFGDQQYSALFNELTVRDMDNLFKGMLEEYPQARFFHTTHDSVVFEFPQEEDDES